MSDSKEKELKEKLLSIGIRVRKGKSVEYLQNLYNKNTEECMICLENLYPDKNARAECGHIFHYECLKKLELNDEKRINYNGVYLYSQDISIKCPACRTELIHRCAFPPIFEKILGRIWFREKGTDLFAYYVSDEHDLEKLFRNVGRRTLYGKFLRINIMKMMEKHKDIYMIYVKCFDEGKRVIPSIKNDENKAASFNHLDYQWFYCELNEDSYFVDLKCKIRVLKNKCCHNNNRVAEDVDIWNQNEANFDIL